MPSKIHPKLRVAVVQAAPAFPQRGLGLSTRRSNSCQDAATQGAQLIAFPENLDSRLPVVDLARLTGPVGHAVRAALPTTNSLVVGFGRVLPVWRRAAGDLGIWAAVRLQRAGPVGASTWRKPLFDDQGRVIKTRPQAQNPPM